MLRHRILLAVTIALLPPSVYAKAFDPQSLVRGSGALAQVTASFRVLRRNNDYVMQFRNNGVHGQLARSHPTKVSRTRFFYLRNYGGKCLDFGPPPHTAGSPVFIYDCNGTQAQQVRVEETDPDHEVYLFAGTSALVIGLVSNAGTHNGGAILGGAGPGPPPTQYLLELQPRSILALSNVNQLFALDGDSVILAANRNLVLQVQNARGINRTPIIAGQRNLADAEFWDFKATDGSGRDATRGFVRVTSRCDLFRYYDVYAAPNPCFPNGAPSPAGAGTVVKIAQGALIDLTGLPPIQVNGGTIRGDRRGTLAGPLLCKTTGCAYVPPTGSGSTSIFEIKGDNVRITGLRLQGTSRETTEKQFDSTGIIAHDGTLTAHGGNDEHYANSLIDHNDISNFTDQGVSVRGNDSSADDAVCDPNDNPKNPSVYPFTRPINVFVVRNFIHHNRMQNFGYGVESSWGGYPLIEGNTFVSNRHAIAAGYGSAHTGYHAWFNLSQADVGHYFDAGIGFYEHDFDMHGMGEYANPGCIGCTNGFGGTGGDYVDIYRNTFLAGFAVPPLVEGSSNKTIDINRHNYELRGYPCHDSDFHLNVLLETKDQAMNFKDSNYQIFDQIKHMNVADNPNQFAFTNPTDQLGLGDFDNDGALDLFLATGTAWYYAPGGSADWRFLSAKTDLIGTLLLGDFDGDGRTDVLGVNGRTLMISWGGVSEWEVLNALPVGASITDLAVGNFVDDFAGDNRSDIFYSDGTSWYVSSGGAGPFKFVNTSSFRVKDLRFGDFDGDGKTDVFGVVSNGVINTWSYSKSATGSWSDGFLQEAMAPIDRVAVADFDGDGRADVMTRDQPSNYQGPNGNFGIVIWNWKISYGGIRNWTTHQIAPKQGDACRLEMSLSPDQLKPTNFSSQVAGIGRFAGSHGADVLVWNGNELCIVPGGLGTLQPFSRQDLR